MRQATQFVVNQRHEPIQGFAIAFAPDEEQRGDVVLRLGHVRGAGRIVGRMLDARRELRERDVGAGH